jgi:hypothetical protein
MATQEVRNKTPEGRDLSESPTRTDARLTSKQGRLPAQSQARQESPAALEEKQLSRSMFHGLFAAATSTRRRFPTRQPSPASAATIPSDRRARKTDTATTLGAVVELMAVNSTWGQSATDVNRPRHESRSTRPGNEKADGRERFPCHHDVEGKGIGPATRDVEDYNSKQRAGSRTAVHQGVSADKGEEYKGTDCWRVAAPFAVCPQNKETVEAVEGQ